MKEKIKKIRKVEKLNQGAKEEIQSVLIVAAEPSSVLYAERFLELYQKENLFHIKKVHFFGVGSRKMEKLGFQRLGFSEEMCVVGFQEVIKKLFLIFKVFRRILKEVKKRKPKVALLIDYPDFNLRLAGRLKKQGVSVLYYISPQIWAWRKSRIHEIKKKVDKMLVILPFEEKIYKKYNVPVEFVGHPLMEELEDKFFDDDYWNFRRSQFGLKKKDFILGLMPGSRFSELDHHLELHFNVAKRLKKDISNLKIALLLAPHFERKAIQERLKSFDIPSFIMVQSDPFDMIGLTDLVLVASGTATLMVGLMERPSVIMYRCSFLSAFLLKMLVRPMPGITRCFGLSNLILEEKVVPEFFQNEASEESLYVSLKSFAGDPYKREKMVRKLKNLKKKLQKKEVSRAILKNVMNYL